MAHLSPNESSISYYITWAFLWALSKATGLWTFVDESLPQIAKMNLPIHEIKYLPELNEVIAPMIISLVCCFIAFLANKLFNFVWEKLFNKVK